MSTVLNKDSLAGEYFEAAARMLLAPEGGAAFETVLNRPELDTEVLLRVLKKNSVIVRALDAVDLEGEERRRELCEALAEERERIAKGLSIISRLAEKLDEAGITHVFIKTLDQYPDMGHDIDFLVTDQVEAIRSIIEQEFNGEVKDPTLSDRLARKTNYRVPGFPTLEQHHGRLGQVGEERDLVEGLMESRTLKLVEGHRLSVPSAEYRLLLAVLQRIYRHFNIRICDVVNATGIIRSEEFDLNRLFRISRDLGVHRAVVSYLSFLDSIHVSLSGQRLLPADVVGSARFSENGARLTILRDHYRFPVWSVGPAVYTSKFVSYLRRLELNGAFRLLLVPAFALFTYSNIKLFPQWPVWKRIW